MQLDADLIRSFTKLFLLHKYDNPQPVPDFHNEMWDICCSDAKYVAIAAPRGHAKSTAISLAYLLCAVLFRTKKYVLLVSDTQTQAVNFLADIKTELSTNPEIMGCKEFALGKLIKDTEDDIIMVCTDGHRFRIQAKGSGQRVRGDKRDHTRPDLIVCDDLEDDEVVENIDRRQKFRRWFFKALLPAGGDTCQTRVVGTILAEDSLLNRLMRNKSWKTLFYSAHKSFDDFANLLWPAKWSEKRLREERQNYIDEGNPEGYSQEYLNNPIAEGATIFRKGMFLPITEEEDLIHYAGIDFAISKATRADSTSIKVAGLNSKGVLKYVYSISGKWESDEIVDNMFAVQDKYDIDLFFAEGDKIQKAIGPFLYDMMGTIDESTGLMRPFINIEPITPSKDKKTRAMPLQGRMKAGKVEWDTEAEWYPVVQEQMCKFTGRGGQKDDEVDSAGIICLGLKKMVPAPSQEEQEELEYNEEFGEDLEGMSIVTGY